MDLSAARSDDAAHKSRRRYNAALYLIAAIALANTIAILYLLFRGLWTKQWPIAGAPIVVLLGLWMGSHFVRYAGAIWLLAISGLAAVQTAYGTPGWPVVVWVAVLSALSVAAFWLLVLSKQFAAEFAYLRRTQPAYKTWLRRVIIIGLAGAVAIAMWNDIQWIEE